MRHCITWPYHWKSISCKFPLLKIRTNNIAFEDIMILVCGQYGITARAMRSKNKKREVVDARQVAMVLILKHIPKANTKTVGQYFKRDHSTVVYAKRKVQDLIETDSLFRFKFDKIDKELLEAQLAA